MTKPETEIKANCDCEDCMAVKRMLFHVFADLMQGGTEVSFIATNAIRAAASFAASYTLPGMQVQTRARMLDLFGKVYDEQYMLVLMGQANTTEVGHA